MKGSNSIHVMIVPLYPVLMYYLQILNLHDQLHCIMIGLTEYD